ncbi:L-threonine 3-dehydrogenase [Acidobacteriota bacterium]|nr:L-threonine 3-dehydrogenase [Acidobacteriota bacterium]
MSSKKILVIGALGQIGTDLTEALVHQWGPAQIVTADLRPQGPKASLTHETLDVLDFQRLKQIVEQHHIQEIYHLAAALSAKAEQNPQWAWELNLKSLLNVLEIAKDKGIKVFWPSSMAAFGPSAPHPAPQDCRMDPTSVYGISKVAGEAWCAWYHRHHGVDVRSLRFPGLISCKTPPGGGTTDYAVDIFHAAVANRPYTCFLSEDTRLPMMYMPDAVRAIQELMDVPASQLTIRHAYNLTAMSFTPKELAEAIRERIPEFSICYKPDFRQAIADSWPEEIDDQVARRDWGWKPTFTVSGLVTEMIRGVQSVL